MGTNERYLSVTQAAKALGVSAKALRLYEKKGLVKPLRNEAGWRFYGTEALTRLHQILTLKHMGLELSAIARLLRGSLASLDSVLAMQEENLASRQVATNRALSLVRRTRARLSCGEALSVDDLTTLTRETIMDIEVLNKLRDEAEPTIAAYAHKYLTAEEYKRIRSNRQQPGFIEFLLEGRANLHAAMKAGDPASAAALEVARMSRVLDARASHGDPDLLVRVKRMWADIMSDPAAVGTAAFKLGPKKDEMEFLTRATVALEAHEAPRKKS
jgi:DNA-binding transcriptional MerR regulator